MWHEQWKAITLAFSEVIWPTHGFTVLRIMVLQSIASISISSEIRASKIIEPAINFKFETRKKEKERKKNREKWVTNASQICNPKMHWTVTNVKARRGPYLAIIKSHEIKLWRRKKGGRKKHTENEWKNIRWNFRNMHKMCWRLAYINIWNEIVTHICCNQLNRYMTFIACEVQNL